MVTTPEPTSGTVPGPGFVAGIRLATALHLTEAFSIAQLLAYHVPPRLAHESVESIGAGMRAFADALYLGPHDATPPYIGHRIRIRRGAPWLAYGDDTCRLCVPAAPSWVRLVAAGGPIRICVLFDPLAAGAGQEETDAHVRASFARGSMRWGTTYHV
ncbi:hypothetical protein [Streptomyces rapamycinicus]|uniref:Uncharacterized protein n=1 Tax=Streptomyces rapamycinicus TaxID=1226757 RepID=A0ABR6LPY8_9ACTN|nr:hypothetical protein [Streptomyces rapamycinicus]AGP56806.1 hypothetical protein M271_26655 [Streptomyces rapamycinicus NRRL 5491]MBB4784418.1 hypothetical protein [Streptomyces rapamycinicus]UTO64730.1 hypothetical protein LJB45_21970 [Streptomyces rapamycinicus]UTP32687.1 hypothetical protein LIV37_27095 [Streptomyces rapamycinicus NRRL 5491]